MTTSGVSFLNLTFTYEDYTFNNYHTLIKRDIQIIFTLYNKEKEGTTSWNTQEPLEKFIKFLNENHPMEILREHIKSELAPQFTAGLMRLIGSTGGSVLRTKLEVFALGLPTEQYLLQYQKELKALKETEHQESLKKIELTIAKAADEIKQLKETHLHQLAEKEKALQETTQQVQQLTEQHQSALAEKNNTLQETTQQVQRLKEQHQRELAEKEKALQETTQQTQKLKEQYQRTLAEKDKALQETTQQVQQLKEQHKNSLTEITQKVQQQKERHQSDLAEKEKALQETTQQVRQLTEQQQRVLAEKDKALQEVINDIELTKKEVAKLTQQLTGEHQNTKLMQQLKEKHLKELENSEKEKELVRKTAALELSKIKSQHAGQLAEKDKIYQTALSTIDTMKQETNKRIEQLKNEHQQKLAEKDGTINDFNQKNIKLQEVTQKAQNDLKDLTEKFRQLTSAHEVIKSKLQKSTPPGISISNTLGEPPVSPTLLFSSLSLNSSTTSSTVSSPSPSIQSFPPPSPSTLIRRSTATRIEGSNGTNSTSNMPTVTPQAKIKNKK